MKKNLLLPPLAKWPCTVISCSWLAQLVSLTSLVGTQWIKLSDCEIRKITTYTTPLLLPKFYPQAFGAKSVEHDLTTPLNGVAF